MQDDAWEELINPTTLSKACLNLMPTKAGRSLNRDGHEHQTVTVSELTHEEIEILNETLNLAPEKDSLKNLNSDDSEKWLNSEGQMPVGENKRLGKFEHWGRERR